MSEYANLMKEMLTAKLKMENRILECIEYELLKFHDTFGISINSVEVSMINGQTFDGRNRQYFAHNVKTGLHLE